MSDGVSFFVTGTPIPQGSKVIARSGSKTWLRDVNTSALKAWRRAVAVEADRGVTFDEPVGVALTFYLPRPKRPRWNVPAVKPDSDKLARAILDGLVDGGLLYDDSRVIVLNITKHYAITTAPGVMVDVTTY